MEFRYYDKDIIEKQKMIRTSFYQNIVTALSLFNARMI